MNKTLYAAAAFAALALSACHKQEAAPKPDAPPATPSTVTQPINWMDDPEYAANERAIHAAIMANPAPANFATKPCIYIKDFNLGGAYDSNLTLGDGTAYDGGAFAYLGDINAPNGKKLAKVVLENERLPSLAYANEEDRVLNTRITTEMHPLAVGEPRWIIFYFDRTALSLDERRTDWHANGAGHMDGKCGKQRATI